MAVEQYKVSLDQIEHSEVADIDKIEHSKNEDANIEVNDKYFLVYFLFYGVGALSVIPGQFFPTAHDYWMYKFRDPDFDDTVNATNRTTLQAQFTAVYSIMAQVCTALMLALILLYLRKVNVLRRIDFGMGTVLIFFVITTIFVKTDTDSWQFGFFIFTLITGGVMTAGSYLLVLSFLEMISSFPIKYFSGFLAGQSVCGIIIALAQILSVGTGEDSVGTGLIYFLIGTLCVATVSGCFVIERSRSKFFEHYYEKGRKTVRNQQKLDKAFMLNLLNDVKFFLLSLILSTGAKIMVHPGLASLVESVDKENGSRWTNDFYVPVITFLLYNVSELVGRELARILDMPKNVYWLIFLSLCQVASVPLFMFCNAQPRHHLSVVFNSDWYYIIFTILFSALNGFIVNRNAVLILEVAGENDKNIYALTFTSLMVISVTACSFLTPVIIQAL